MQGNQPTVGSVAPAFEIPGQAPVSEPPSPRVTGFQPPKKTDVAETGIYVEREINSGEYVAKEHFGDENKLTGEPEPRYYVNVQLDERGMMASDFVLREGGRRSGSLFGKNEFLQAKRSFEQRNGPGSVKGAYGKWGSGDNLDTFNARYKIATDKGLPHDEAMIEAARKTKTGEWARAAGFNKVNITKAEGPPGAFTNVEVEFTTEVQPAAPASAAPTGMGQPAGSPYTPPQSGGPGSTVATQMPPGQVISSSSSSITAVGASSATGIRRDQAPVATAGKGPPSGEPKTNVPAPGRQTTERTPTEPEPVPQPVVDEPTGPVRPDEPTPGEVVGDYRLLGEAGLQGQAFVRRILGITRIVPPTGIRFRPLFESFIAQARTTTAQTLRVTIEAISNPKIFRNVAEIQPWIQSLGGTVRLPDLQTVEITIPLR